MAVFNVSFANKGTQKVGSNYGFLVDQLSIYESQLESDGKLTPGDYKLLEKKAMEIYSHPGLSAEQRSNIDVKIASYKAKAGKETSNRLQDSARLDREIQMEKQRAAQLIGNDPATYARALSDIQSAKLERLFEAVQTANAAGEDPSALNLKYLEAVSEYQDSLEVLETISNAQPGAAPTSGFVAYVKTNAKGEIVEVDIGREGAKSGYLETNGLYGGMKIYGKLNRKENGKNVFLLGNDTYSAVDSVIPAPDGSLKQSVLINESLQRKLPYGQSLGNVGFVDMDPVKVTTQKYVPNGGYGRSPEGFIYRKNDDGSYTKYVNTDIKQLGIEDNQVMPLISEMEQSISPFVTETVDSAVPAPLPVSPTAGTAQPVELPAVTRASTTPEIGMSRLPAKPTERAPQTSQGIASRAFGAAKGFLSRIFGGQ